jgi:hypothetical protein
VRCFAGTGALFGRLLAILLCTAPFAVLDFNLGSTYLVLFFFFVFATTTSESSSSSSEASKSESTMSFSASNS